MGSGGDIISTMGRGGIAVAVAANDDIYQIAGGHVVRYNSEGNLITEWNAFGSSAYSRPIGLAVIDDVVYVSDRNMSHITKYTTDGDFMMRWSTTLSVDRWDSNPEALVVDAEGNILVADGKTVSINKMYVLHPA